jgi:hypothetical protein
MAVLVTLDATVLNALRSASDRVGMLELACRAAPGTGGLAAATWDALAAAVDSPDDAVASRACDICLVLLDTDHSASTVRLRQAFEHPSLFDALVRAAASNRADVLVAAAAKCVHPLAAYAAAAGGAARASAVRRAFPPMCAALCAFASSGMNVKGYGATSMRLALVVTLVIGEDVPPASAELVMQQPGIVDAFERMAGEQCGAATPPLTRSATPPARPAVQPPLSAHAMRHPPMRASS